MNANREKSWSNSLANYGRALSNLELSCLTPIQEKRDLSGIIKDFEITYELSWKLLKQFLQKEGHDSTTARDTFKKAFQLGLLSDEKTWLDMIEDRNQTVHTYDENFARAMVKRIQSFYLPAFLPLLKISKTD